MVILTITLLIIIGCVLYYYFKKKLNYFEERGIPYAPGWPLLGNFASAAFRQKHFVDIVHEVYNVNQDAKYVGAFDFTRPAIMLRDLELVKDVAIKNFDSFPDHNGIIDENLDPIFGGNLFNMKGERWKSARNLLTPAFTSSKMKGMFELIVVCANNIVNYLNEQPQDNNEMVNTKDLFSKFSADIIATCAFGINVDSLKDPNNEFYVHGKEATNPENFTFIKILCARTCPKLFKFLKIRFISQRIINFFENLIRTTIETRDEKGISRPDMLQLMMDARSKDDNHFKLNITEMTAQAFIFFFGGFDTISTQSCMIAHLLAINPDVQTRLQDEIDEVMKETNGKPTYETILGMPYLDAVFNETLRMHPQFLFVDRLCIKEFELPPTLPGCKPFIVERGMIIWIPAAAIHKDPKYFENPENYDPDRYYQKKVKINDAHNLGFGIGPRSCIGNRFAILEIKILFFFLLSKFHLKANSKTCNPLTYGKKNFALAPEGGYWLAIQSRNI